MSYVAATITFPDAELDIQFDGKAHGVYCTPAMLVEVEADRYATNGIHVESMEILPTKEAKSGEYIGPGHWLRDAAQRFLAHPNIVRQIQAKLEDARDDAAERAWVRLVEDAA